MIGDLITVDHKVLNEEGESRDNHRHTVVVQDIATQWIQYYPCRTKTSQETEKSLRKLFEQSEKRKVIHCGILLERKKILRRIIMELSSFNTSSIGVLLKERFAEERRNVCNQVWMTYGGVILWNAIECVVTCEMSKKFWQMGKHFLRGNLENDSKDN